ncbi:hypothetical protein AWB68_00528 [Caballeronia choica]|jgi:hypothetical protein|uniref:Uncharacterized protein n=1 Tax=Caballeronia choica TaxID=326476 RepID=A0A158FDS1_9BURK|nr:hypothetical protein AWB68_00528 [Caballeronia choica]
MFKRLVFLVLLALPGAFLVLTVVSIHPRYRGQVIQLAGLPAAISLLGRTYRRFRGRIDDTTGLPTAVRVRKTAGTARLRTI